MADLLTQIRDFYSGLEPTARRAVLGAGLASILGIVGVGIWASRTNYVTLSQATSVDEAAEITQALSKSGVPYRLEDGGRTILVPSTSEVDARRAAAANGLYVGLEGLPTIPAFVTPGQEQLYAKRMLQGELVRMINALSGVASSEVQISLPERTAYLRKQQRATASVTLTPDPGSSIDPGSARSVAALVSHAVADMTPQDVTVVDASTMRVLWGDGGGGAESAGDNFAALAVAREAALAAAVRGALGQVLGDPAASSVTVRVELETSATQTTTKSVDPNMVVTTSEKIESESDTRAATNATGVPGTDANLPERAGAAGAAGSGREREVQTTSYDFGSSVSTISKPAGDIRRISATVFIDAAAFAKVAAGRDEAALRKTFEAAVAGALGVNTARGDAVVLDVLPFAPVVVPEETLETAVTTTLAAILPSVVALVAVILGFVFVVRPLMRLITNPSASSRAVIAAAIREEEEAAGKGKGDPIDLAERIRSRVAALQSHAPSEVSSLVEKESEHSAEVLRRWIRA